MAQLVIRGWRPGFRKVAFTKLVHGDLGLSMSHAKDLTDAILDGHEVTLAVRADKAQRLARVIHDLGADVEFEATSP